MQARFANIDAAASQRLCHSSKSGDGGKRTKKDAQAMFQSSNRYRGKRGGGRGSVAEIRVQTVGVARENTWRLSAASGGESGGGPTAGRSIIC